MNKVRPWLFLWALEIIIGGNHLCLNVRAADQPANVLLDQTVARFDCTNQPISKAIGMLASVCSFPINSIIDTTEESSVTISAGKRTCASILKEIIASLPGYTFRTELTTVLVYPQDVLQQSTFPLNRTLKRFQVEFWATQGKSNISYGCQLDWQTASAMNVALPFIPLGPTRPNCEIFPCVRNYDNRTLLEILTELSAELHRSWACGRVHPSYAKKKNTEWASNGKDTYWLNESPPFYHISWGDKGAFHGTTNMVSPVSAKAR